MKVTERLFKIVRIMILTLVYIRLSLYKMQI